MNDQRKAVTSIDEKPLVTFTLFAYNQEKFIREAVEAALAQEYSPLEIILSDDCSTDNTFEIMKSLANNYSGKHTVRLNRNPRNLGMIGHLNKIITMVSGEFIIAAAGDDISIPARTNILVAHWIKFGKTPCSLFTNAITIDSNGKNLGSYYPNFPKFSKTTDEFIETRKCWVGGFSHGFSKDLATMYGPITEDTFQEDGAIAFRALLNAGVHYITQPTVFYRRHGGNSYDIENYSKFKRLNKSELGLAKGQIADLKMHRGLTIAQRTNIEKILRRKIFTKYVHTRIPGIIEVTFVAKWLKARLRSFMQSNLR